MRRLSIVLALALLSGCAALLPSLFDPTEHGRLVNIAMLSQDRTVCADRSQAAQAAASIQRESQWVLTYGSSLPANDNLVVIEKQIAIMADEMHLRYQSDKTISTLYCENKLQNINIAAQRGMKASAKRPRI